MRKRVSKPNISTEAQFNEFLLADPTPRVRNTYLTFLRRLLRDDHRLVMTHGDLHPRNVLVSTGDSVEVAGLIDWEMSGVYPEYWEYVKSLNTTSAVDDDDWCLFLPEEGMGTFRAEHGLYIMIAGITA
jgi:aminoglycoside phosphotransferase (APT) family kinase protein